MVNFSFGIPKKNGSTSFAWRPFIVLGLVLCIALGLRVYQWAKDPVVPAADIESVGWNDVGVDPRTDPGDPDQANDDDTNTTNNVTTPDTDATNNDATVDTDADVQTAGPAVSTPPAINLAVPFTSQAPLGIWDAFTEDTCEEASLLMVYEYYQGAPEGSIDPTTADADFHAMVAAEESLGFGLSISSAQFISFAQTYNGTSVHTVENPSADDLRALLAAGHPVIIPAFGRRLGNPFFTGEGPLYHMLVLRGYTATTFITNDPGTRHGENYQYSVDVIMNAIGDWDGDSPDGGRRVLVVDP